MKLYLAIVLALCATVYCDYGDYEDCCTIEDRREVQRLWNEIWGAKSSTRRITIALGTLAGIIKKHPDVAEFIKSKGITSKDDPAAKALSQRIFTDLDTAINLLDDPAILREYLRLIAIRHAKKVGADKAPVLLDYFIEGLNDALAKLGGCHNLDAFKRCFKTIGAISDDVAKDSPPPATLPVSPPAADASAPAAAPDAAPEAAPEAAPSA